MAQVDAVILTWNDPPEVLNLAIQSALRSRHVSVAVTVVDNGSSPAATCNGDVHLIRSPVNLGVSAGRNLGGAAGVAPIICFLDSDAELEPRALRTLTDVLLTDERVGLVGPRFVGQPGEASGGLAPTLRDKLRRGATGSDRYRRSPRRHPAGKDVDFVIGACQVVRRSAFASVGGYDERYFYGPEDVDLCLKLRNQGMAIVQVDEELCHHPPRRRHRNVMSRQGARHGVAVLRHLWRHRRRAF